MTHKHSGCGYLVVLVGWEKSHPLGWNIIVSSVWNSETFDFTAISKCEIGEMRLESPVRSHLKPFTSSVICKTAGRCGGMRSCLSNINTSFFTFQGTFSLIIEALHTDSNDDLSTGKEKMHWMGNNRFKSSPCSKEITLKLKRPQKTKSDSSVVWPRRGT